jgi:hypothetical protein
MYVDLDVMCMGVCTCAGSDSMGHEGMGPKSRSSAQQCQQDKSDGAHLRSNNATSHVHLFHAYGCYNIAADSSTNPT